MSVYSISSGALLGLLYLEDPGATTFYETVNTPCVVNNRVYVLTALHGKAAGRLYALDITPSSQPVAVAWSYDFGGPSGASPTCTTSNTGHTAITFDGENSNGTTISPAIYTVIDKGTSPSLLWSVKVAGRIVANMPQDRGGIWYFTTPHSGVTRLSLRNGTVLQQISTKLPTGSNGQVASAISIGLDAAANPTMLFGLQGNPLGTGGSYVASINAVTGAANWYLTVNASDSVDRTQGQFALVRDSAGLPRIAFTTHNGGLRTAGQ